MSAFDLARLRSFTPEAPPRFDGDDDQPLAELVVPGRIVELCGEARTTAATAVLAQVQREGETVAWVQPAHGDLYPPDLAASGVDVHALIVIHVPAAAANYRGPNRGPAGQCRAAELLLRSGGFGMVVLDLSREEPRGSTAWQGRLLGLARQHEARLLILRSAGANEPSLGPLIGLRVDCQSSAAEPDPELRRRTGRFWLTHEVLKNKSGGPLQPKRELVRGPWGLRPA